MLFLVQSSVYMKGFFVKTMVAKWRRLQIQAAIVPERDPPGDTYRLDLHLSSKVQRLTAHSRLRHGLRQPNF